MKVNPADLRFTQDSIACHFKAPHEHVSITMAREWIQTGEMSPDDFPRLRVISYEGCLWSVDNRRLWVFRTAKCSQITVRMTTMHPRLEELIRVRSRYIKLSKAEFLPRVRKSQNMSPALTVTGKGLHSRVPEVLSRYNLLKTVEGSKNELPQWTVASTAVHRGLEGSVSGSNRISPRPRLFSLDPLVTMEDSVIPGLRTDSSFSMKHFPSSASGSFGGRPDIAVTRTLQPTKESNVDISCSLRHCAATQERHSHLEKTTSAHTPLLPATTHEDGRPTMTCFGRVRNLIFGCFGYT